jgi:hypothetical protein
VGNETQDGGAGVEMAGVANLRAGRRMQAPTIPAIGIWARGRQTMLADLAAAGELVITSQHQHDLLRQILRPC